MTGQSRAIFVMLLDDQYKALIELSEREWRRPEDQAAKILIEGLRQAGVLPEHSKEHPNLTESDS